MLTLYLISVVVSFLLLLFAVKIVDDEVTYGAFFGCLLMASFPGLNICILIPALVDVFIKVAGGSCKRFNRFMSKKLF